MPDEDRLDRVAQAEKSAGIYAWEHFRYHAGQRQSVFRFFVTLVGAATLAYGYSLRTAEAGKPVEPGQMTLVVGSVYIIASFLFWRLDRRSRILIGIAEEALKNAELKLANLIGDESIRLMDRSDQKKSSWFPLSYVESFRQVYGLIFILVGSAGVYLVLSYFGLLICPRCL